MLKKIFCTEKRKELILYIVVGAATTIINICLFQLLQLWIIEYRVSNLIAIILTKIVAYILNKSFVFHSKCGSFAELCQEFLRFFMARGATGVVDFFGVIFLVEVCLIPATYAKCFISLIVIILNYALSKIVVFKQGESIDAE